MLKPSVFYYLRVQKCSTCPLLYSTLIIVRDAPVDPPADKRVATKSILLDNCNEIVSPAVRFTMTSLLKVETLITGLNIEPGIGVVPFSKILEPAPIPSAAVVLI